MSAARFAEVAVLGAGTMGAGIAQVAAAAGCNVRVLDRDVPLVEKALAGVRAQLARLVERGRLAADDAREIGRRLSVADSPAALGGCELVVEAVFEDLAVKHAALHAAEAHVSSDAVFATNTSSLSVAQIAAGLRRPQRCAGMHFFNPAPLMPLVEVIAAECSAPDAVDAVFETAIAWGKVAVRARDVPGFIVNRVARPYYLESLRLLSDGVAPPAQIDAAMRQLGFRMGPFELMDLVGIDVNYAVSCSVYERLGRPERLRPHDLQRLMVEAGALGRKTGRGFYDYSAEPPTPVETRFAPHDPLFGRDAPVLPGLAGAGPREARIQSQVLLGVLNEAGLALGERVASADDIDLAMQKGTNYPRGPLAWGRDIGAHQVRAALEKLEAVFPGRFAAAPCWGGRASG